MKHYKTTMSKVIRISDKTFSRLQNLAEPLVDTPASVIDKLLDEYETGLTQEKTNEPRKTYSSFFGKNLFLVPADKSNIKLSIQKKVKTDNALKFLTPSEKEDLNSILKNDDSFNCWAMTESNRSTFESMNKGDFVLLSEKKTGKFNFIGSVKGKIESKSLGNNLWSFTPGKPWSLIYILDGVNSINIDKREMVKTLGYAENFWVPGVIKVQKENLENAVAQYGNFTAMINSLNRI